ncbi:MAG: hypothetical protein ACOCXG_02440 [Nanoarchaeota archaeon]
MVKKQQKKSFFESLQGEVVKEAGDYVKNRIKKKAIRIGEISLFATTAFILMVLGVTNLLGYFFPLLSPGYNYLLMAVVFLIMLAFVEMQP